MSKLNLQPMKPAEAIVILERLAHTESKWPGTEDNVTAINMAVDALHAWPADEPGGDPDG